MSEGHFECKVSGKRESSSGIFLTLQIQPDDYTPDLATLRVGSALVLGWAEVVNTGVEPIDARFPEGITPQRTPFLDKIQAEGGSPKKWSEYARSQQAAILCADPYFWRYFIGEREPKSAAICTLKLREHFRIESRTELDYPENHVRWDEFVAIWNMNRDRFK